MGNVVPLPQNTVGCFREALASGELGRCIGAFAAASFIGVEALVAAEDLFRAPASPELTRIWALLVARGFASNAAADVRRLTFVGLSDPSASVRCAALGTLALLKDPSTITNIIPLLFDPSEDHHAWWEPTTVAGHAREALLAIGTPEALAALGST